MKKIVLGMLVGLSLGVTISLIGGNNIFYSGKTVYVSQESENFREAPKGQKRGVLLKGTPLKILEVQDKWLRVTTEGYIWKESVTDDKDTNKGDSFHAAMILVKTRKDAEEILQEIQSGADFQQVASQRSIGPERKNGGDLGNAYPGDFAVEIENAILALKAGELSEIVSTKHGYHIFKRLQ